VANLSKKEINDLIIKGWKCEDYGDLCPLPSHKSKTFRLIEDPSGDLTAEDLAKDESFSGREGNAVILRIGEISARLSPYEKTEKQLIIPPGRFIFFMTKEKINMPLDCDGTLFMNPSTSNRGVHFFTLGHVDPGFRGHLTATLLNTTSRRIPLKRHEGVLYLIVSRLESPSKPHSEFHENPQVEIGQAMKDLSFNMNPGFVLTTKDFATKKDLDSLRNILITIISVSFTVLGLIIALLKLL